MRNRALPSRRLPVGAELLPEAGAHVRVWAPAAKRIELVLDGTTVALEAEPDGYYSALVEHARAGQRYGFRLDGDERLLPDPASRFQPDGPHGLSQIVDPRTFTWSDAEWRGVELRGAVLYELHVGTFTQEGTFAAAAERLPALREFGVTVVELMPVADFPGSFGWGYDGVDLFAPSRLYGEPDDLRRFVDRAHGLGLGVVLDVVYNHLGPDGNYLGRFARGYTTDRYANEWGEALDFDGEGAQPVRDFFVANAGYWIDEFHFDGLRLDATQSMHDASPEHILSAIERRVRQAGAGRATLLVGENEPQEPRLVRARARDGYGLDALWNDDLHHAARVAATGKREAYFTDYTGSAQELVSAVRWGYLYQGQPYRWQKKRRGRPAFDLLPEKLVTYLQNHDQIANALCGARLHELTSPGLARALTALWLLAPGTPMLFQGQEFAASSPFFYFADHTPGQADQVRAGRAQFLAQFPSVAEPAARERLPDPGARATFERCKLDWSEREQHATWWQLHHDLLMLRRQDRAFSQQARPEGAVLGDDALVLRWLVDGGDDRALVVNLGRERALTPQPEPLLAPPDERGWRVLFSTEHVRYGGCGVVEAEREDGDAYGALVLPGQTAMLLGAHPPA